MKESMDDKRYRMQIEKKQGKTMQYNKGGSTLSRYEDGGEVSERYANMNVDQYRAELLERENRKRNL